MEAIIIFLSSFFGSFSAFFFYNYFKTTIPSSDNSSLPKSLQRLARTIKKPAGVVLHSPTSEEEEKEMEREAISKFEELSKKLKEGITQDYRK